MALDAPVDAICFDLDGTLVDTAPCIAAALNAVLAERGLAGIDSVIVTTFIGGGVPLLLERALRHLGVSPLASTIDAMLDRYCTFYLNIPGSPLLAYPGVAEALSELNAMSIKLAVVTNTFEHFAQAILVRCGIAQPIRLIVSADTLPQRKPDPAPLRYACKALGVPPERTVFVGDSSNDAIAAVATPMRMVCMTYGYNEGKPVRDLPCAAILESMRELPAWVRARSG